MINCELMRVNYQTVILNLKSYFFLGVWKVIVSDVIRAKTLCPSLLTALQLEKKKRKEKRKKSPFPLLFSLEIACFISLCSTCHFSKFATMVYLLFNSLELVKLLKVLHSLADALQQQFLFRN